MTELPDDGTVMAIGALLGVAIPQGRAEAIARDLAVLAGRLAASPVQPVVEDAPADAMRALR
jgi:uncharacterized membrane protein